MNEVVFPKKFWFNGVLHQELCVTVADMLANRGFSIKFEKYLRPYFVDIYAKRNEEIIIVECGCVNTEYHKLTELSKKYKVYHYPFLTQWLPHPPRKPKIEQEEDKEEQLKRMAKQMGIENIPS